jgi:hypothetical protein
MNKYGIHSGRDQGMFSCVNDRKGRRRGRGEERRQARAVAVTATGRRMILTVLTHTGAPIKSIGTRELSRAAGLAQYGGINTIVC